MAIEQYILNNIQIFAKIVVSIICITTGLTAFFINKYYALSKYQGFRLFRNAFIYFTLAYLVNLFSQFYFKQFFLYGKSMFFTASIFLFEFFMTLGTCYLVFSLVWKQFSDVFTKKIGNLQYIHIKEISFYVAAIGLALLDFFYGGGHFMFISMIFMVLYALLITHINYKESRKKSKSIYQELYFINFILLLVAWIMNYLTFIFKLIFPIIILLNMIITPLIFISFLYLVIRIRVK